MNIEMKETKALITYGRNNKKHPEEQIKKIIQSIKEFGFKNPVIIDKYNVIVAGHGRVLAAGRLGIEKVPCIIADDLTEEQVKAYRLADNGIGKIGSYDIENINLELEELIKIDYDISFLGFQMKEKEEEEEKEKEFTQELLESHNYIILYFDNDLDWQVAQEKYGIKSVKGLQSKKGMKKEGIGRVVKGADFL